MTQGTLSELKRVLYQALGERIGLAIRTPEPEKLRQAFYRARQREGDAALGVLQFRLVELPDAQLVICRGSLVTADRLGL